MNIVIATGGFDPLHEGHIAYLQEAKKLGDELVVGLNSDEWLTRKKGRPFMTWKTRAAIVQELKSVDSVFSFDDSDDSARNAIQAIKLLYPGDKIIFANGGDRTPENIPEMTEDEVEFAFGVGSSYKSNSSSFLLKEWKDWIMTKDRVDRAWGYYVVLSTPSPRIKAKMIYVAPHRTLSYQKHNYRQEFWVIHKGKANILHQGEHLVASVGDYVNIAYGEWHQLINNTDEYLEVFEVQHGTRCEEDDIVRI